MTDTASNPVITLDGASSSGKSTLGRRLALAFRLPLIDTGLFYRAVMVAAIRAGIGADNYEALARVARDAVIEIETDPACESPDQATRVDRVLAGEALRDPRNAPMLSRVSRLAGVRAAILAPQRALATHGAVAVGRDCGTVVFPEAPVKLYLDAPERVRERRRREQLRRSGMTVDAEVLRGEISDRDRRDSRRSVSPLRPALDAHLIDTGSLGIEAAYALALNLCAAAGITPVDGQ